MLSIEGILNPNSIIGPSEVLWGILLNVLSKILEDNCAIISFGSLDTLYSDIRKLHVVFFKLSLQNF